MDTVRLDQWLWSVRLTKTRAQAAAACRGGHVTVNARSGKPATAVAVGDRIEAHLAKRDRVVVVTKLVSKRIGAALAVECFDDQSPPIPRRDEPGAAFAVRDRGAGRPTKRDRRDIDRLRGRRNR